MPQLTMTDVATDFDRTTTVVPLEQCPDAFSVDLDDGWASLVGMHGGYLCAVVVRAAEALSPGWNVRTMSTSFLRNAQPGPATVTVRDVRRGRSMATVVVDLIQDERLITTTRLTQAVDLAGVEWSKPLRHDLPPPADCIRFDPPGPVTHFARADSAFDPARLPLTGDRARVHGYVRPLEARPIDAAWLAMASDWFPPPAFALLELPTGGISIDLTTHIHRTSPPLGDDEWLVGTFEVEDSTGGLGVEHGRIATMDGTLVAESFQTRLMVQR